MSLSPIADRWLSFVSSSQSIPAARILLVVCIVAAALVQVPTAFQCASCTQNAAFRASSIGFDFSGPSFEIETWRAAATEWTNQFRNADSSINVSITSGGSWTIATVTAQQMPGAWGDAHTPSKVLYIREDALTKGAGFVKWLITHEMGHALGLSTTDCSINDSVMADRQPDPNQPGGVSGTTSLGCAVERHIVQNYEPEPVDYCANGGCTPGYAPEGSPGCSEASIDECGCCLTYSPIILDLGADGVRFSSAENGTLFTINDMGKRFQFGWPTGADDVWLWLDRNGNGLVDNGGELFGNATRLTSGKPAPNGFVALAELDANQDGQIDRADPSFAALRVWSDANRDGESQEPEIGRLDTTNVVSIGLSARWSRHTDAHGNTFKYRSVLHLNGLNQRTWAWDVYPAVLPSQLRAAVCAAPKTNAASTRLQ
ncbi:hypothetical protein BH18ACI5_BH18ACI5_15260 [soil metagenome]